MPRLPTDEDKKEAVVDFESRLFQSFSFYDWRTSVLPLLSHLRGGEYLLVQNAAIESTLMSVREINSFFIATQKGRFTDDIKAEHYPNYSSPGEFLAPDEKQSINKKLAHLTYHSIWERQGSPLARNPRVWNSIVLVSRAVNQAFHFWDYLEQVFLVNDPAHMARLQQAKGLVTKKLTNMNNLGNLEIPV